MSYSYTLLDSSHNRSFFSCSVPPSAHEKLPEDFKEISRIHFYFGNAPIDFMIDAVEKANPEHLYLGKPQLAFSIKEVFQLIPYSHYSSQNKTLDYFINEMFKDICNGVEEVMLSLLHRPSEKNNVLRLNTMVQLFEELEIVNQFLSKNNTSYNTLNTRGVINSTFNKIEKLKEVYPHLNEILSLEQLRKNATISVKEQLLKDFSFDMKELASIYDVFLIGDKWIYELNFMRENIEKNPEGFKKDVNSLIENQRLYVKNMRSLSMVLSNGVINYIRSFLVSLSMEKHRNQSLINRSCDCYYSSRIRELESGIKNMYRDIAEESKKKLEDLKNNKERFFKDKMNMKKKAESELFNCYAIENMLINFLDNMKKDIIGVKKESKQSDDILKVTRTSDNKITAKYKNKVIYAIPEDDLEVFGDMPIAVFSMNTQDFECLSDKTLNNSNLMKELKCSKDNIKFTNFNNMTSFISSLKDDTLQEFFLGNKNIEVETDFIL